MKKLLSGLLLAPIAISACGGSSSTDGNNDAKVKTTLEYSLGHGKYTDANNGTLGTQNASYNVIKSMITDTDGKLTYAIEESTKYVDTTHADTKIDLPATAKATPTWVEKTLAQITYTFSIATIKPWYTEGANKVANVIIKGNDGDATVALFGSTFETELNSYKTAYDAKSDTIKAEMEVEAKLHAVAQTASSKYSKDDLAYRYAWFEADAVNRYSTEITAWRQAELEKFPLVNGKRQDNTGQSLRYVYDVVPVNADFINKLWDGTDRNLAWESKTDTNYGGDGFNFVTNTDKLVAFLNKDFDTCAKVNAVKAADIKAFASNKAANSSAVTGATFSEGGLYRAAAITAAQKACK